MSRLNKIQEQVLNTNSEGATTTEFEIKNIGTLTVFVSNLSGRTRDCVVNIQLAGEKEDGTSGAFMNVTDENITGQGCKVVDAIGFAWVKIKVTTVEGATSSSTILINGYITA